MRYHVASIRVTFGSSPSRICSTKPSVCDIPVPFRAVCRNLRFIGWHFPEDQLANWKNFQPRIAHETDIQFAALDVFFLDHVGVVALMNKCRSFAELLIRLDKRRLRTPVGSFLFHGFDQNRELDVSVGRCVGPGNDHEIWHVDTVVR